MGSKFLETLHGKLEFPAFFPDATHAKIKGVENKEIDKCKLSGLVVNTYHLLKDGLIEEVEKKGGIHKYMGFDKPIISDSGGFQVMSLIHQSPELGEIDEDKVTFKLDGRKIVLTPEKCIQIQMKIGADIIMCLDDCTRPESGKKEQELSVDRTIRWAERCKKEFDRLTKKMIERPLIFGIVQGGESKKLRKKCADGLVKIGFDGYAFGGWPVKEGKLLNEILEYTSKSIPNDKPKYAMGLGKPQDIIDCVKMGYDMFDCVIPTRDARHKRLFAFVKKPTAKNLEKSWEFVYIRGKEAKSKKKVSDFCGCECCEKYSLGEVVKMFREKDALGIKLATIHNLNFYSDLCGVLRKK